MSKESCIDAKSLMSFASPHCLFLELCEQRVGLLLSDPVGSREHHDTEKVDAGMSRTAILGSSLLSKIQDNYAAKLGVQLGGEFREAFQQAKLQQRKFEEELQTIRWRQAHGYENVYGDMQKEGLNGCHVILGDRPVRLTLLRAWEALGIWQRIKLICCLLLSCIKQPSEKELLQWMESIMNDPTNDILSQSMEELGKHFPPIVTTVIHERDVYMATKLLQTMTMMEPPQTASERMHTIVAIVGAGHIPGIKKVLNDFIDDSEKAVSEEAFTTVLNGLIETKKDYMKREDSASLITDVVSMDWSKSF